MASEPLRVLVVVAKLDEAILVRGLLAEAAPDDYIVNSALFSPEELQSLQDTTTHDVAIVRRDLEIASGHDLLLAAINKSVLPIVILADYQNSPREAELFDAGAADVLVRDSQLTSALFERTVRHAIARHAALNRLHQRDREQFRQAQKMEAVGRLAGGVAHDFNNLLTAIIGYSELVLAQLDPRNPARSDVGEIREAGLSAQALTRQLLAFSRKQILQPQILDLNVVVTKTAALVRRLIGEDVDLTTALTPRLDRVSADPGQIEQVIMNLAVNARDAMPNGGKLTIETGNVELDETFVTAHRGATSGPHVMIAVSDTGVGMDETVQAHLFEPFYTTKESGKGTGLGLATIYGIVKQSGGSIWVYSEVGRGSTFKIYLPRVEALREIPRAPLSVPKSLDGSETVLLVEDQRSARSVTRAVLTRHGYQVIEAANGSEALQLAEQHGGEIHLLLADVVLASMSGRELARRLLEKHPMTRVLYTSGYTDEAIVHHGVLDPGLAFIQKPYTPDGLLQKVREVLDASPPPRA